jgi:hypothetical protein
MKKLFIPVLFLASIMLFSCGSGPGSNNISFELTTANKSDTVGLVFSPGKYSMDAERVSVMTGSNSGIEITFTEKKSTYEKLVLKIFLPTTDKFMIWNSTVEKVEIAAPETPFTLTEKDFDSVYSSRVHRKINAYISLNKETQVMSDQTDVDYLSFSTFKIEFTELSSSGNNITMKCSFEGNMQEEYLELLGADYDIKGEFSLNNIKTGIMNVDD